MHGIVIFMMSVLLMSSSEGTVRQCSLSHVLGKQNVLTLVPVTATS